MCYHYPREGLPTEAEILNGQHDLWKRNLGYLIHPKIASRLGPDARIADIGTGTASFLQDVAAQGIKTWQLDGFDISTCRYPAKSELVSNIRLIEQDTTKTFPLQYHRQYDFVHIRLLVAGINREEDWGIICQNAAALLKPGGALQWEETSHSRQTCVKGKPDSTIESMESVESDFSEARQKMPGGFNFEVTNLPVIFKEAGFTNCFQDVVASDNAADTREALSRNTFAGIFDWERKSAARGNHCIWLLEEAQRLRKGVEQDIKSGSYARYDIHVTVGLKPELDNVLTD